MFRNRMVQLARLVQDPSIIGSKLRGNDLSDQITQSKENPLYLSGKQKIKQLKQITLVLQKSGREYFKTTRPQKQRIIYDKINGKISQGNNLMKELKPIIEQINNQYKAQSEKGDKSSLVQCNRITSETNDALKDFRQAQEKISQDIKSTIQRQANLIQGQQISEKQLQDLVLHPQKGQEMLRQKLLDAPSVQLENKVSDIIDKCNDVLKLEKSMRQCLSMMEELALLVHLQGEKLLTIQTAIDGAKDHVTRGDEKLQKGKEYHKKKSKKNMLHYDAFANYCWSHSYTNHHYTAKMILIFGYFQFIDKLQQLKSNQFVEAISATHFFCFLCFINGSS